MRFKSKTTNGFTIYAVTGINAISFAIDFEKADLKGLLGFAVERHDLATKERKFLTGFKVFKELIAEPTSETSVSTLEHPLQSFVWDDYVSKSDAEFEYFFYPMKGSAKALEQGKPIKIALKTEAVFTDQEHDVFFNSGTASKRAYTVKFGKQHPLLLREPKKTEALNWLSRDLSNAIYKFIAQAKKGDALRCCFYEFSYVPVLQALKKAIELGVDVQVILDMKDSGKEHSQPRDESLEAIQKAAFPMQHVIARTANPKEIQHNKFMVFLEAGTPKAVWTGSTNISFAGIHGHTNVGHWVRNQQVASKFMEYWALLKTNPGALATDSADLQKQKHADLQKAVFKIQEPLKPTEIAKIAAGTTAIFSPQPDLTALKTCAELMDKAKTLACITLPFGINKTLTDVFLDNTEQNHLVFMLFDTQPKELKINEKQNVYVAWGVNTDTNTLSDLNNQPTMRALNMNVEFIHTKILLMDPLSADPIVVSGSANFTNASTTNNDENMLIIRGNKRVADICLTEYNRLFHQFYAAMALQNLDLEAKKASLTTTMYLDPTDNWLKKYDKGTLRYKRVKSFVTMSL